MIFLDITREACDKINTMPGNFLFLNIAKKFSTQAFALLPQEAG